MADGHCAADSGGGGVGLFVKEGKRGEGRARMRTAHQTGSDVGRGRMSGSIGPVRSGNG